MVIVVTSSDPFDVLSVVRTSGVRAPLVVVSEVPGTMTADERRHVGISAVLARNEPWEGLYAALRNILEGHVRVPQPLLRS